MVWKCDFWDISCCSKTFFELPIQRNERRKFNFEIGSAQPCMQNEVGTFSNFSCSFLNPNYCSNVLTSTKGILFQKLWPFTVPINCSSDLKNVANSRPSVSNFKGFPRSREQFFLTVGEDNFGNKIPILNGYRHSWNHYIHSKRI